MTPDALRRLRERRGESPHGFAQWLNGKLGRWVDDATIGRWESGAEPIPAEVAAILGPQSERPARIVAIANPKRGVGRTTTALALAGVLGAGVLGAGALGEKRRRVLVVDADPQATATARAGVDAAAVRAERRGLEDVLFGNTAIRQALTRCGRFDMLPCTVALAEAQVKILLDPDDRRHGLRDPLQAVRYDYDAILVDCPPDLGPVTVKALVAADRVLIPTRASRDDVRGIPLILDTVGKIKRRQNPGLAILGILPTLFDQGDAAEQQVLSDLGALLNGRVRLFAPVPRSTRPSVAAYRAVAAAIAEDWGAVPPAPSGRRQSVY